MKRRVDEAPFGGPRTGPTTAAHHRILTTQNVPPTIQYQLNPGVLKVAPTTTNNSITTSNNNNIVSSSGGNGGVTGAGNSSSNLVADSGNQATVIGNQTQQQTTTQYTTYQSGMTVTGTAGGNIVARSPAVTVGGGGIVSQASVSVAGAVGAGLNASQQPPQQQQIAGQQMHVVNTSSASNASIRHKGGVGTTTTVIGSGSTSIVTIGQPTSMATLNSSPVVVQQQQQQSGPPPTPPSGQFQRLKVEDALVYLDNVKSKFGDQPQVYNDFLDIMKEFKSQSIDTPGVIERVSTLFKGHPDLIVGFNTFLPPGYKIEIQANDTGYSYQVSVSMPSPSRGTTTICPPQQQQSPPQKVQIVPTAAGTMIQTGAGPVNLITHSSIAAAPTIHGNSAGLSQSGIAAVNTHLSGAGATTTGATTISSNALNAVVPNSIGALSGTQSTSYVIRGAGGTTNAASTGSGGNNGPGSGGSDKERSSINVGGLNSASNLSSQSTIRSQMENLNSQGHNLHHISQAHHIVQQQQQQQQQQQSHTADSLSSAVAGNMNIITGAAAAGGGGGNGGGNQNQPVEFNHAISYVNKIKKRFQQQPDKYKRFLEILHQYQKEQKNVRGDAQGKQLTEQEVYSQVAILFDKNEDLLKEFGQFLPDATSHSSLHGLNKSVMMEHNDHKKMSGSSDSNMLRAGIGSGGAGGLGGGGMMRPFNSSNNYSRLDHRSVIGSMAGNMGGGMVGNEYIHPGMEKDPFHLPGMREKDRNHIGSNQKYGSVKRSPSFGNMGGMGQRGALIDRNDGPTPAKRHKPICRDVTLAEASKQGSLSDYAFFDKVRKALRAPEVYESFLRCLVLFNQEIITKAELLTLTAPFLSKFPDLHRWFQEFLGPPLPSIHDGGGGHVQMPPSVSGTAAAGSQHHPQQQHPRPERSQGDHAQEIDLSTCKRLGASYCALPKTSEVRKCSGRTALCREVLNDTWVSFPTWSEDSTFVTSRKTQYEEIIYRCEDERFELDVVIETNSATIRVLEGVQKKMSRMSSDEVARFRLDDCLGGNSPTIHQKALRRIYGDKAADIIQGLKKNPGVAVPVVLRRLKTKEEEWREAQKGFNKQWKDQNEKFYLKSLDHQGINFKQNDIKALRSKSLFNEIETLYDERHEQNDENAQEQPVSGPHLVLPFKDKTILEDAANLLIHHVKRQTGIQKQEKTKIKQILRHFVPDLFFSPRQQLSDDEREEDKDVPMDIDPLDGEVATTSTKGKGSSKSQQSSSNNNNAESGCDTNVKSESGSDNKGRTLSVSGSSEGGVTEACAEVSKTTGGSKPGSRRGSGTSTADGQGPPGGDEPMPAVEIKQEEDSAFPGTPTSGVGLPLHAISKNSEEAYTLFFANNNWYLFLRLHAILCERLRSMYERAQLLAAEEAQYKNSRRESTATALRLKPKSEIQVEDYYSAFLDMLKNVLDGNMDANNYEDSLREMFGIHAYIAFTLDRVVSNAVRQLQHCVTEKGATECVELFHQEQKKNGAGGLCRTAVKRTASELAYQRRAEQSLQDENCFKIYIYKLDCRVTIELLDTESDETEKTVTNTQEWSTYVERYTNPGSTAGSSTTNLTTMSSSTKMVMTNAASSVTILNSSSTTSLITTTTSTTTNAKGGGDGPEGVSGVEIKVEKLDDDLMVATNAVPFGSRKALFLKRNVRLRCPGKGNGKKSGQSKEDEKKENNEVPLERKDSNDTSSELKSTPPHRVLAKDKNVFEINDPFLNKRPPERLGENSLNSDYHVVDCTEVKLNLNSYKMIMLTNQYVIFYQRFALRRAKQNHEMVTKRMKTKFKKFVDNWLQKNVTESQQALCNEWLMGRGTDHTANTTVRLQENDIKKTPYAFIHRYKVMKLD